MNILERHIAAYIVECITGDTGENNERTYEILTQVEPKDDGSFLSEVHKLARTGLRDPKVRFQVADMVTDKTLAHAQHLAQEAENKRKKKKGLVFFIFPN